MKIGDKVFVFDDTVRQYHDDQGNKSIIIKLGGIYQWKIVLVQFGVINMECQYHKLIFIQIFV